MQSNPTLNKMAKGRLRATEINGREELNEELIKCRRCRQIIAVPNAGFVQCSCGQPYKWRRSLPSARQRTIEAQP